MSLSKSSPTGTDPIATLFSLTRFIVRYHNFPGERVLLVTHSNQALNQLFEKIMELGTALDITEPIIIIILALDIDERHLIRLGHGHSFLETEKDFGKYGRVDYMLVCYFSFLLGYFNTD